MPRKDYLEDLTSYFLGYSNWFYVDARVQTLLKEQYNYTEHDLDLFFIILRDLYEDENICVAFNKR